MDWFTRSLELVAALAAGWLLGALLNRLAVRLLSRHAGAATALAPRRWRRMGLQAAAAACLAVLWLRYGPSPALLPPALVVLFLLLIAAIDIDSRRVLNEVVAAGALAGLARATVTGGSHGMLFAVAGGAAGFLLFLVFAILGRGALGAGDVKLAGVLGLILGYPAVLTALLSGVMIGGVVILALLLGRRVGRKTMVPYAPFLAAGGILMLLWH